MCVGFRKTDRYMYVFYVRLQCKGKELIVFMMIKNGDSIINVQVQALAEDSDAISHAKN